MRKIFRAGAVVAIAAILVAAVLLATGIDSSTAAPMPAPMPAPTPVSVTPGGEAPIYVDFFDAEVMTADTTSTCIEVSKFERADVYWSIDIDAGDVNTSTVYLQFGNSPTALVDGVAVGSAVAADATFMGQYQLFGGFVCLKVDTTDGSSGAITITADALVK